MDRQSSQASYDPSLDPDDAMRRFLRRFHAEHDGAFPETLTSIGPSSYALLSQFVRECVTPVTVVDLGCGTGRLLEILAECAPTGSRLIGVDMVPEQLDRAGERIDRTAIELLCDEAHSLSLPDASVDWVLVHMGLALMLPLEDTLSEIDRVLRPGGSLAVVTENDAGADSIDGKYIQFLLQALMTYRPDLKDCELGDKRTLNHKELSGVISQCTRLHAVGEATEFELVMNVSGDEFVDFAVGDQTWALLPEHVIKKLRNQVRSLFPDNDTPVDVGLSMQRMLFRKENEPA